MNTSIIQLMSLEVSLENQRWWTNSDQRKTNLVRETSSNRPRVHRLVDQKGIQIFTFLEKPLQTPQVMLI
jgi:hypothetical protein